MKPIREYMDIRFDKHKKHWDTVGCIVGDEGVGKSNLALGMVDYWQEKLNGKCKPKDIKHMCMTGKDFATDIGDSIPFEITVFDEAGELDSRRAMSKFNVMLTQAYKVIRADRLFSLLVLPEFWDLESRFRNRRLKFLIHVYKRGRCAVWLKDKLRTIADLNQNRYIKNMYIARPDFYATFPIYKGVLAKPYVKMKEIKTTEARKNLMLEINNEKNTLENYKLKTVKNMREKGMTHKQISEIVGVADVTVGTWLKKAKAMKI